VSDSQSTYQRGFQGGPLQEDPYPIYAQWRQAGPLLWIEPLDHWFIVGHQAVMAALRDIRMAKSPDYDAIAHTRRRLPIQNVLTPALVEQFRPRAKDLTDTMLTKAAERGEMDLIGDFAAPLVISTAAALLGLPAENEHALGEWVRSVSGELLPAYGHCTRMGEDGPAADPVFPSDEVRRGLAAAIAAQGDDQADTLISRLLLEESHGGRLDDAEVLDLCVQLLVAAHDSTVGLIGNGVNALLDNPFQLDRLRTESSLITTAVEELLRYDSPTQYLARSATEDIQLAGQTLREGQAAIVMLGAANRDPDAFEGPDVLDLSRSPNHHVAFGRGGSMCLGASLARMAGQVAIGALTSRFPLLRRAGEPVRRRSLGGRGFSSLPVGL
jgi:pimeloyl-[acyl-carrier protein] synthase